MSYQDMAVNKNLIRAAFIIDRLVKEDIKYEGQHPIKGVVYSNTDRTLSISVDTNIDGLRDTEMGKLQRASFNQHVKFPHASINKMHIFLETNFSFADSLVSIAEQKMSGFITNNDPFTTSEEKFDEMVVSICKNTNDYIYSKNSESAHVI